MSGWKQISNDRLMREHEDGFIIIKPMNDDQVVPFDCPLCGLLMRLSTDPESYKKHGACSDCASRWAEGHNAERWADGWRPDPEIVQAVVKTRSF